MKGDEPAHGYHLLIEVTFQCGEHQLPRTASPWREARRSHQVQASSLPRHPQGSRRVIQQTFLFVSSQSVNVHQETVRVPVLPLGTFMNNPYKERDKADGTAGITLVE